LTWPSFISFLNVTHSFLHISVGFLSLCRLSGYRNGLGS
jgi:hypothetical protein